MLYFKSYERLSASQLSPCISNGDNCSYSLSVSSNRILPIVLWENEVLISHSNFQVKSHKDPVLYGRDVDLASCLAL